MEESVSSARSDDEMSVRLTGREVEAFSLGLRTLLITMRHDEALCGVATAGLAKLSFDPITRGTPAAGSK